jgi:hypothetical protein
MKRYSIWMDDDTLALLEQRAEEKGTTTAKLIRQILDRYIGATDVRFAQAVQRTEHVGPGEEEKS